MSLFTRRGADAREPFYDFEAAGLAWLADAGPPQPSDGDASSQTHSSASTAR
jgi:hypothetical protein